MDVGRHNSVPKRFSDFNIQLEVSIRFLCRIIFIFFRFSKFLREEVNNGINNNRLIPRDIAVFCSLENNVPYILILCFQGIKPLNTLHWADQCIFTSMHQEIRRFISVDMSNGTSFKCFFRTCLYRSTRECV